MFDRDFLREKVAMLAENNIFIGTSSWKYEGWIGMLYTPERYEYRGKLAKSRFDTECLREYADTFRTVCVDAGFYRFPDERYIAKLTNLVGDDFRFSFKVTDEITTKNFPRLARHGERAGKPNKNFLNADLFASAFLEPLSAYREKIGVLMFEFSQFYATDFQMGRDFVSALDDFLGKLPQNWQYAVEIRNKNFLHPDYFQILDHHNVAHVFSSWSRMPDAIEQMEMPGSFTAEFFASRFLLRPGRSYEDAVKAFSPYKEIKEPYPPARKAISHLLARRTKRPSFIFVNNRLEGNSLMTILQILESLESPPV